MILKGSQRGGGTNLAIHLMRVDDNEHVRVHELRGFASDNLKDAFREVEAISKGTKCSQYLFSLSLNPPSKESVSTDVFTSTIDRLEERLGLTGQPRAIVFHEKEGRTHAHCVWSRIDGQSMTARQLSFFKSKLLSISRDLYLEHGWDMPKGIANSKERNPLNFTLAEWQQAKRNGVDPREVRHSIQECWKLSDNPKSFGKALEERGLFLAKGDRRGHVVLDHQGEVYALSRLLDVKAKDVRARLGTGEDLPSVDATKARIGELLTPAIKKHIAESRNAFADQSKFLGDIKSEMTQEHRQARLDLALRQANEWEEETRNRAARVPTGLRGLWWRITGKYQDIRRENEQEAGLTLQRHESERVSLVTEQKAERSVLQTKIVSLRLDQVQKLRELRREIGRYVAMRNSPERDRYARPDFLRATSRARDRDFSM
jgi:hypothetical protein